MPANSATIRGKPGPHITRQALIYNPETGVYTRETEYSGTQQAIAGLVLNFRDNNRDHRQDYEGGISRVTVYDPIQAVPVLDKYEIQWEMEQRSIFSHPAIQQAALDYDTAIDLPAGTSDPNTFRKLANDAIDGPISDVASADPVSGAMFVRVVNHLRAGIDSWEQEYIVLRRTRTVPPATAVPCNIYAASLIYTTAQLDLPSFVLFSVPSDADISTFPNPDPTNFQWGWRRRPSTSTIQGQANEQTSEFILAAWSLLFYTPASGLADW